MRNDDGQVAGVSDDSATSPDSRHGCFWLPTLRAKQASICLPVSRGGAQRLVNAFLVGLPRARGELLILLNDEPSLTLWALINQRLSGIEATPYLSDLADWLAQSGPVVLSGISGDLSPHAQSPQENLALLAFQGIAASQLAMTIAKLRSPDEVALAVVLGLLVNTDRWLQLSKDELAGILPTWLMKHLPAVDGKNARRAKTAVGCVAEALAIIAGKEPTKPAPEATLAYDLAKCRSDVDKEWASPSGDGEIFPVSEAIAKLARLQQLETEFQRQLLVEKIESLKELAYGAGHEINNPLANISARAQTLLSEETEPEKRRKLVSINSQAFRAHEMIADMMLFARPPELQVNRIEVGELLQLLVSELRERVEQQQTKLVYGVDGDDILFVSADRTQLTVAIRALIMNACEALGRGGTISVAAQRGWFQLNPAACSPRHEGIEISVSDSGPGIDPLDFPKLFDPFYSGREANRGIGFGLCKCWRIVTSHGGRVTLESEIGKGARFGLIFPASRL